MKRIPFNAITQAVAAVLKKSVSIPVYDNVPPRASYPFITLGSFNVKDTGAKLLDKMQVTVQIHIWSTYRGKREINALADQVINALASNQIDLSKDNYNVFSHWVDFFEVYPEDEHGYNGIVTPMLDIQNEEE